MSTHRTAATPTPGSDEAYVREVIDSAMAHTRPPHDLSGTALARGRRLRARRRLGVAAAAVAAGVAVGAAGTWLGGGAGSATRVDDLVATQPPAPEPSLPTAPAGWWDMPATEMVDAVRAIAPDGVTLTDPGPLEADSPEGGPAHGSIVSHLAAATGPGSLNVILSPGPTPGLGRVGTDVDVSCDEQLSGRVECTELRDDQGSLVGRRLVNRWGGTVTREVTLRRDGGTVYAASANTLDDKWGADSPLSAEVPPLTLDDLEDLVRNDVWVSYHP